MSSREGSKRRSPIVAILMMLSLLGVTAWSLGGCSQKSSDTTTKTTTTETKDDGDVHVKVDLPDTITIKP